MNRYEKNILELRETLDFIAKAGGFTPMDTKTLEGLKARAKGWESQLAVNEVAWYETNIIVRCETMGWIDFTIEGMMDYVETATARMERIEDGIQSRHPEFKTGEKATRNTHQEAAINAFFECLERIDTEKLRAENWNTIVVGGMVSEDYYRRNGIG